MPIFIIIPNIIAKIFWKQSLTSKFKMILFEFEEKRSFSQEKR